MTNVNIAQSMVSRDKQLKSEIQSSDAFLRWSEFSKRDVAWKVKHDPEALLEQELVGELMEQIEMLVSDKITEQLEEFLQWPDLLDFIIQNSRAKKEASRFE
jgi:hypothetical protein